jgi:hypothetical protein
MWALGRENVSKVFCAAKARGVAGMNASLAKLFFGNARERAAPKKGGSGDLSGTFDGQGWRRGGSWPRG